MDRLNSIRPTERFDYVLACVTHPSFGWGPSDLTLDSAHGYQFDQPCPIKPLMPAAIIHHNYPFKLKYLISILTIIIITIIDLVSIIVN